MVENVFFRIFLEKSVNQQPSYTKTEKNSVEVCSFKNILVSIAKQYFLVDKYKQKTLTISMKLI